MADIGQEKDALTQQDEAPASEPVTVQDEAPEFEPVTGLDEEPAAEQDIAREDGQEPTLFSEEDVDRPRSDRRSRPLTEKEFIREQKRLSRLDWFNDHKTVVFVAVGVILAALIFLFIHLYNDSNNPVTWLVQSCVKDFDTSFDFEVAMSKDGEPAMKYVGSIVCDSSAQTVKSVYEAEYSGYSYTGALLSDGNKAAKGRLYNKKWTVEDCTDQVRDFFSLDKSLKNGRVDTGALLRFLGLTSEYSSTEMSRFLKRLTAMLSSESSVASVTATSIDGGTRYDYRISVGELFGLIAEDGAPIFFNSSDYNDFKALYEANKHSLESKVCYMSYVINAKGYLSFFGVELATDDAVYGLSCIMSNFGETDAELPEGFLKAAEPIIGK